MKIISNTSVFYLDKTLPKGSVVVECGKLLLRKGYGIRILNTINFKKSMHYNPFAYLHSEKDILKLVTTLIANTKGGNEKNGRFLDAGGGAAVFGSDRLHPLRSAHRRTELLNAACSGQCHGNP